MVASLFPMIQPAWPGISPAHASSPNSHKSFRQPLLTAQTLGKRPSSIKKKCSNPFVRMLFKKEVEVATYKTLFYDHEIFKIRRLVKERYEEEA
jgi:hypothetical protein